MNIPVVLRLYILPLHGLIRQSLGGLLQLALLLLLPSWSIARDLQSPFILPNGFSMALYATVPDARQMAIGTKGTVFVGTRKNGRVYAVQDVNRDGYAENIITIAKNLTMPSGIAISPKGDLYVAAVHQILRLKNAEKALKTKQWTWTTLIDALPKSTHHGWKNIAFGPDGRLYVPIGFPCNVCLPSEPFIGTLLAIELNTSEPTRVNNQKLKQAEIMAQGIRNSVGFDWHPEDQQLWFSDNGRDWLGDDIPPDEINLIRQNGQHFGFPFVHGRSIHEKSDSILNKMPKGRAFIPPVIEVPAHSAPLGVHFYKGQQFPKQYKHALLVAEHGSWNRTTPIGYQVVAYWFNEQRELSRKQVLVDGFLTSEGKVFGRPVAFLSMPDGSLLISDDHGGKIWRLSWKDQSP